MWLLASDMDGTVIPLDNRLSREFEIAELRSALEHSEGAKVAYVTGRPLPFALEGISQFQLPRPDFVVSDVGTEISEPDEEPGRWKPVESYREQLSAKWAGKNGDDIRKLLMPVPGLRLQEPVNQKEFKASYYFDSSASTEALITGIEERLGVAGLRANIITSRCVLSGDGLLDVLPPETAKHSAVRFLQNQLGLQDRQIAFSGDSGNDEAALCEGFMAIIVSNAAREVKSSASRKVPPEKLFIAERPYAAGVLDGLRHFGFVN